MTKSQLAQELSHASQRIMNASAMQCELEALRAENRQREREGKEPANGYNEFMAIITKWKY